MLEYVLYTYRHFMIYIGPKGLGPVMKFCRFTVPCYTGPTRPPGSPSQE